MKIKNIRNILRVSLGIFTILFLAFIFIPLNGMQDDALKDFIEGNSFFPFPLSSKISCGETKITQLSENEIKTYLTNHIDDMMEKSIRSRYDNLDYSKLIGVQLTTPIYNNSWGKSHMLRVTPFIHRSDYYGYILYTNDVSPIDIFYKKSASFNTVIIVKTPNDDRVPLTYENLSKTPLLVTWDNYKKSLICNIGK